MTRGMLRGEERRQNTGARKRLQKGGGRKGCVLFNSSAAEVILHYLILCVCILNATQRAANIKNLGIVLCLDTFVL